MREAYDLDRTVYVWDWLSQAIRVGNEVRTDPPVKGRYITYRNGGKVCIANKRDVYDSQQAAIERARAGHSKWVERYIY